MVSGAREGAPPLVRFRRACRADVGNIVSLVNTAYRGEGLGGWTTEAHLVGVRRADAEVVEEILAAPENMVLLGEIDSDLVACVQLTRQKSCTVLGMLAVQPELQDHGIGGAIICEAERICRDELGSKEIRVQVLYMRHDIIAWCERRGYTQNGERVPFPYGDERLGIPQRDGLEFAVLVKALE